MIQVSALYPYVLASACFFSITVYSFCLLWGNVIIPGLSELDNDAEFIKAFQVMDGRIQNNEPTFVISWLFSILTNIISAILAWKYNNNGSNDKTIAVAAIIFMLGHVSTATQNVPRNNLIRDLGDDIDSTDATTLSYLRNEMVGPWQKWNTFRTIIFGIVSLFYLYKLIKIDPTNKSLGTLNDDALNSNYYSEPGEVQQISSSPQQQQQYQQKQQQHHQSSSTSNFSRYV